MVLLVVLSACGGGSDTGAAGQASSSADSDAVESAVEANAGENPPTVSGSTDGLVTVGDVSYELTTAVCFAEPGNLFAEGLAQSDGEFGDAWISISADTSEDYDDDGTPDVTADVTIEHGNTDGFGSAEAGMPDLFATRFDFSTQPQGINAGTLTFEITGSTITGAGELTDANGVLIPFGDTVPFTFATTCS